MTSALDISRRNFLVSSAATAGGLALGFHVPFAGEAAGRPRLPRKSTPGWSSSRTTRWSSASPASEMGQGTLTGLAQLVAEELDCDWSKVTTEYPTPGQNVARSRVWGNFQTAGSRGIRDSHDYVRKGGAAARHMLVQAAADEWNVPAAECSVSKGVITHGPSGRTHDLRQGGRRGRQARGAEGRPAEGSEGLDDRRQAAEAARHRREAQRQAGLQHRREAAGHAERRDEGLPGLRRQAQELRCRRRSRTCRA